MTLAAERGTALQLLLSLEHPHFSWSWHLEGPRASWGLKQSRCSTGTLTAQQCPILSTILYS